MEIFIRLFIKVFLVAGLALTANSAIAKKCDLDAIYDKEVALSLPDNFGDPIEIELQPSFVKLGPINGDEYQFTADFYLTATWMHESLAEIFFEDSTDYSCKIDGRIAGEHIWTPGLDFINQISVEQDTYNIFTVNSDGYIEHERRIQGIFSADLDFKKFPFDQQTLRISLVPDADEGSIILLGVDPAEDWTKSLSFSDWRMIQTSGSSTTTDFRSADWESDYSTFNINVSLERIPTFYLLKVMGPVFFMVLLSLSSFSLNPATEDYDPRLGLAVTLLLTVVAYTFIAGDNLPVLSYLTSTDLFLALSFFVCLMCVVVTLALKSLNENFPTNYGSQIILINKRIRNLLFLGYLVGNAIIWFPSY